MAADVDHHLNWLRARNLRDSTIYQRGRALHRLTQHLDGRTLRAATPEDVTAYLARHNLAESRATELSHLRGFYRWAHAAEIIDQDPTARIPRPKTVVRLPRPPATGEVYMALDLAPERIYPWLLLAGYAGLRAAEISLLRSEDIWWHTDPPMLIVVDGKGGQQGALPVCDYLATELSALALPRRGWLFTRRDHKPGPNQPHQISHLANRYLHDMGFNWTIHQLRHWFGTETQRGTGNLRTTQELMRHKSSKSTELYTQVLGADRYAAVQLLPTPPTTRAISPRPTTDVK